MSSELPVGSITIYAGANSASLPDNWMICDGSTLSIPQDLGSNNWPLYAALETGSLYGKTPTHFNLPDLQGYFVRGSASSVTGNFGNDNRSTWDNQPWTGAQKTLNPSGIGTTQLDEYKSHSHSTAYANRSSLVSGGTWTGPGLGNEQTQASGGNETRPVNMYMFYIIKVQ
ncbi:MAG: tail fiber protein [Crocinitomicaceae bacterium]|nr:phage tail protein [Flavobacteriales bacterium]NQZ38418.1 tail fiber protein [Crocinitomicaceae bacterium]